MNSGIEKLKDEIRRYLNGTHFHLMELKCFVSGKKTRISIFLDRDNGSFSHSDCADWSSKIQDIIDGKNLVPGDYRLEVSSPGIGRPLKERWEFSKNLERRISAEFTGDDDSVERFSGILIEADEEGISLKDKSKMKKIGWDKLKRAQLQTPW